MAKTTKNTKRKLKKKVSKSFVINCDTEAEILLPFFMNVVNILNEQIEASKVTKPRRKVQKIRDTPAGIAEENLATPTTQRSSRKRGMKLIQKIDKRQPIAPYRKRKSLLPYFNIKISKAPQASSLLALPAVPLPVPVPDPEPEPAPLLDPAAVGGSNALDVTVDSNDSPAPIENQQSGAASEDIFSVMRNNLNNICNGEFGPQDAESGTAQAEPEADNLMNSDVDIYDCLSNRLHDGWND